jgi:hypothetical protein
MNLAERFKLDPGSAEARAEGCICDPQEPRSVDGRKAFVVEPLCPIHGTAVEKALLEEGRS